MPERALDAQAALRAAMDDMNHRHQNGVLRAAVYVVFEPVPVDFLTILDAVARQCGFSAHRGGERTYDDAQVFWIFNHAQ